MIVTMSTSLYLKPHFKDALRELESQQVVLIEPAAEKRLVRDGQVTLSDKCIVTFR